MSLNPRKQTLNKKQSGSFIRRLRTERDITQRDLAEKLGLKFYSFISQIETGASTVPPALYVPLAEALEQDRDAFVLRMLVWNEPEIYAALFGRAPIPKAAEGCRVIRQSEE